jgi:hypothetical protein
MSSPEWSKLSDGLACNNEVFPESILDAQSSFALAYHSTNSIRVRCHKNVCTLVDESLPYSAEAILTSKTPTGHQLVIRLNTTEEKKVQIIVCSDDPQESSNYLSECNGRVKGLLEKLGNMDETEKKRVFDAVRVEMKLDTALSMVLSKLTVGEIYPVIGIVRETLIKALQGFDPIHIETGESMEILHKLAPDAKLDEENSKLLSIKILDWKRRLSKIIDEMPLQKAEVQPEPEVTI